MLFQGTVIIVIFDVGITAALLPLSPMVAEQSLCRCSILACWILRTSVGAGTGHVGAVVGTGTGGEG